MKSLAISLTILLGASSCSLPVMFRVEVDEQVVGGRLFLNEKSARLMRNADGAYWGKWTGSDASGRIEIDYPDGSVVVCKIGYVTHGLEIQDFQIRKRNCLQVVF